MQTTTTVRRAELIGALSLATDLATDQPFEHGLRAALIAIRIADALGLVERTREDVYYVSLLQYVGCTAEAHVEAEFWGDELRARRELAPARLGSSSALAATAVRNLRSGSDPLRRASGQATHVGQRSRGSRRPAGSSTRLPP